MSLRVANRSPSTAMYRTCHVFMRSISDAISVAISPCRFVRVHDFLQTEHAIFTPFKGRSEDIYQRRILTVDPDAYSEACCRYIATICFNLPTVSREEDEVHKWCRLMLQWWMRRVIVEFLRRFKGECERVTVMVNSLEQYAETFQKTHPEYIVW